jgi:hypothetical protein
MAVSFFIIVLVLFQPQAARQSLGQPGAFEAGKSAERTCKLTQQWH